MIFKTITFPLAFGINVSYKMLLYLIAMEMLALILEHLV